MKKLISIILVFIASCYSLSAQEYPEFLHQALENVENNDEDNFIINIRYFSTALKRKNIRPQQLSTERLKLYTQCLYKATQAQFTLPDDMAAQVRQFLMYHIEQYPDNMFALGYLYENGLGDAIVRSSKKAKEWYEKAAGRGNIPAMNNLGLLYFRAEEYTPARNWFEKAAENENAQAMSNLAYLYETGKGVSLNYQQASEWYQKACNSGLEEGCRSYNRIRNK